MAYSGPSLGPVSGPAVVQPLVRRFVRVAQSVPKRDELRLKRPIPRRDIVEKLHEHVPEGAVHHHREGEVEGKSDVELRPFFLLVLIVASLIAALLAIAAITTKLLAVAAAIPVVPIIGATTLLVLHGFRMLNIVSVVVVVLEAAPSGATHQSVIRFTIEITVISHRC